MIKFSTIANATGFSIVTKGKAQALADVIHGAYKRLQRVSGLTGRDCTQRVSALPRTGDNIALRITWQQNARP